jgi:hypothetical protein
MLRDVALEIYTAMQDTAQGGLDTHRRRRIQRDRAA